MVAELRKGMHASRVIAIAKQALVFASLWLVISAVGSCASNPPRVNDVQQVNQSLRRAWLLQSYRSTTTLEPLLQALVNAQFEQMRVTINGTQINGTQLTAQGPGVQVVRTYQIQEAADQTATLIVSEPTGASVRVRVEIRDSSLTFRPFDAPWGGEGTLQRL
jgi:hypothetical protein